MHDPLVVDSSDAREAVRPSLLLEPTRDEQLALHALLRDVPGGIVERRLLACPSILLAPGDVLIHRGELRDELYLVLRGRLGVVVGGVSVASIPAGQTVGELALIEPHPACADVVALAPSRVLALDAATFWDIVRESHQVALNMLRVLAARVRQSTFQLGTIDAQRQALEALSRTDALTGLANRRWLDETLPRLLTRAATDGSPLSLALLDIDHFKTVNDTWGHGVGDRVLTAVAEVIRCVVRPTDFAARVGGEEMLIILPATPIEGARIAAERVRHAIRGASILDDAGRELPMITASFGVAGREDADTPDTLLARADGWLYEAKRSGRDRVAG